MEELLLKSEQFEQLKEILSCASPETKVVFCLINSKKLEENFDVIVSLLKENNYKELFKEMASKASIESSKMAMDICNNETISWFNFILDCPKIANFLHEYLMMGFVRKVYDSVSYEEFKKLSVLGTIYLHGFISDIIPRDKHIDFLSYESDGKYMIANIRVENWIDKILPNNVGEFLRLCLGKASTRDLIGYSTNCWGTRVSVDEARVKSVFTKVPEDLKVKFLMGLFEYPYNGSDNIFGWRSGDYRESYYEELICINFLDFVKEIEKERWIEFLCSKGSVDKKLMFFERLNPKSLVYFIKNIPLDDFNKLIAYPQFEKSMNDVDVSKAVNDRLEEKKTYSISSLFEK